MKIIETTAKVNQKKRVRSTVVEVEVYGVGNRVFIGITREYPGNRQVERKYSRPYLSVAQANLADCLFLGALRGNTHIRPWLGGGLGWVAQSRPFR